MREKGIPDPDCGRCEGSGKTPASPCRRCNGCGKVAKYPIIILKNEMTGEERMLKLDVAALINEGEVKVIWYKLDNIDLRGVPSQYLRRNLRFKVSDYIARNMIEIDIDTENSVRRAKLDDDRDFIYEISLNQTDIDAQNASWRECAGQVKTYHADQNISAHEILDRAQKGMHDIGSGYYPEIKDSDGMIIAKEWVFRPLRPFKNALGDMRTAVAAYGYSLGLSNSFIETGMTGPAFFLLDDAGRNLGKLGANHDMRMALENSWLNFQKIKVDLPLAE